MSKHISKHSRKNLSQSSRYTNSLRQTNTSRQPKNPSHSNHPHTLLQTQDTYTNPQASLGAASTIISSGTWIRSGLTSNPELLTTLYRESWLAKRIIDMPAEDMTRAWYSLTSSAAPEDLTALRRLESRHMIRSEITSALRWARLYGGSLALMVIRGEEDLLSQPLRMDALIPGCFQGLLVVDRAQGIAPSLSLVTDLDDPDFGLPEYYDITADFGDRTFVRVHHPGGGRGPGGASAPLPAGGAVRLRPGPAVPVRRGRAVGVQFGPGPGKHLRHQHRRPGGSRRPVDL